MSQDQYNGSWEIGESESRSETLGRYTAKTFTTMFLGLLITFATAYFLYYTGYVINLVMSDWMPIALLITQLVLVFSMSGLIKKMSPGTAMICFFAYSFVTGMTFSVYFLIFEMPSLIFAFAITGLYFGIMAAMGYFVNLDLSRIRNLLLGGLIFLIVANIVMIFIPGLTTLDRIASTIGVVIFLAFTAYDTQKIKALYQYYSEDAVMLKKASIFSALQLYLDFINLFLYILRFVGRKKR